MKDCQIIYTPVGVPTFHLESAQAEFESSVSMLHGIDPNILCPEEMLLSIDALGNFLEDKDPDLVIFQNITFANSAYMEEILRRFHHIRVLIWTVREPVIDGGRLRLNSLTGAFSAGNALRMYGRVFEYVYGSADEEKVRKKISAAVKAIKLKKDLEELKIAQIGHTPQGFGFGRALDCDMLYEFGTRLESIEARELIDKAKSYNDDECKEYLEKAKKAIKGLEDTSEKNLLDFARLYRAYDEYVKANGIGALASRCWPDFFTAYGTPVCAVLAMLNDEGIASACEADAYGALSMYIGVKLSGKPVFFGDPVSLNEEENTVYFWHCGTAACSLAREDTGACAGVHCNRKIGPTLEFGCRPSTKATVFRIGREGDGTHRSLIMTGEILDMPQQFLGTSLVVKMNSSAEEFIHGAVEDGWEPQICWTLKCSATESNSLWSRKNRLPQKYYMVTKKYVLYTVSLPNDRIHLPAQQYYLLDSTTTAS